jgi:hypothetical protein
MQAIKTLFQRERAAETRKKKQRKGKNKLMKIDSNPSNSDTLGQSNIPHSLETFDHDP